MTLSTDNLYEAVMALPVERRFELMNRLSDAMQDEGEIDPSWLAELDRRAEDLDSGRVAGIPWETTKAKVRAMVESKAAHRS